MKSLMRWLTAVPFAAFVTFFLFVTMMVLIKADFKPEEKIETANFEINPKVEDIKVEERQTVVVRARKVITPPPPPMLARQSANQPTVAIASLEGAVPDFEAPKLDRKNFKIAVSDRDAQPLVRIPAQMPPRFEQGDHSGHCKVKFDVSPSGQPYNVVATYCTSSLLKRATVRNVESWKYSPKIVDGVSVSRTGVITKISFQLSDEYGKLLPEPSR